MGIMVKKFKWTGSVKGEDRSGRSSITPDMLCKQYKKGYVFMEGVHGRMILKEGVEEACIVICGQRGFNVDDVLLHLFRH